MQFDALIFVSLKKKGSKLEPFKNKISYWELTLTNLN